MTRWHVPRERLLTAMEQFVWDIDMPEELYDPFCLGLMRLMLQMEMTKLKPKRKRKRKGNIIPFRRTGDE